MALTLTRVHEYARHRDSVTGELRQQMIGHHPYLSLKTGDSPTVYLQDGRVYYEGGEPILGELPDWVRMAMTTCTPEALRAVGFAAGVPININHHPPEDSVLDELASLSDEELRMLIAQVRRRGAISEPAAAHEDPGIDPYAPDPAIPEPFDGEAEGSLAPATAAVFEADEEAATNVASLLLPPIPGATEVSRLRRR